MNDNQTSAITAVKALLEARFIRKDVEAALFCLTDDVVWIGSGKGEAMNGISQCREYFAREAANPAPCDITYVFEAQRRICEHCGAVVVHASVSDGKTSVLYRISALTIAENERVKICQLHLSASDAGRQADVFPAAERPIQGSYPEFFGAQINAGVIGGYYDGDYALYTINDQFLQMLGYETKEEFLADNGGRLMQCLHPEDVDATIRAVRKQAGEGGKFQVAYRMRKRDGGYIWIENHGSLITTEEGRNAIISICTDVTGQQETLGILKNQADQLYLYRVCQNASAFRIRVDARLTLIYGNDRFYQMIEYTPEEFQQRLDGSTMAYVHPEDWKRVDSAVRKAVASGSGYIEFYMRILTGKGNLRFIHAMGTMTATDAGPVFEGVDIDVTEQKLTERHLYERDAMFAALLENSHLCMWTYDIKTHVAKLIGGQKHNRPLVNHDIENYPESAIASGFIKESSVQDMRKLLERVNAGEKTASADIWYTPKEGEAWCERVTYLNIFDKNGAIIQTVGIGEDITEHRVAQQQYEEELAYQQSLQGESLVTKVRANLSRNILESYEGVEQARICYDAMPYDAAIATLAETGYKEEDRRRIRTLLEAQKIVDDFERGKPFHSFDYRRRIRDGAVVWVNMSIKTYRDMQSGDIKSFLYTANIDRKRINEEIIQAVASAEHDYIMLANLHTDEFSLYSKQQNTLALPPPSGKNFAAMCEQINRAGVAEEDVERAVRDMTPDIIRENLQIAPVFSAAYCMRKNGGKPRYKKIQYFWLDADLGQLIMTRSDVTDVISAQQRQQELLKNALLQAERANSAKTDFLSKMSHEIRTPMNAIIGMNALAAKNIQDPQTASDCVAKVGISARYLLALINDILDMSRIESGKMYLRNEEIPFDEFIHGVNTVIYAQASANKLYYDAIAIGCLANAYIGDAMKLQQILINLLGNAVKFTSPGGKVQLIISQERVEHDVAHMKFTINDTGVGISEEFQKVMFSPFEQEYNGITTPYGGTGLGLAITKNLVSLMGGSISVSSIVGVGTEFVVNIPLGVCSDQKKQRQSGDMHLERLSALVVDDEILICEQTQTILLEIGMKAEWVTGGRQAVERVKEKWAKRTGYDIILVDWKMPDMDGIETARKIRQIVGPEVTIIIITAYEWAEIEKEAKAAGVNLLITKPLFKSSLVSTFERILSPQSPQAEAPDFVEYNFTGKRTLLVEDHLLNVEVAKRLLQAKGMEVEVAENGLAAIEAFATAPLGYFDVILMDIRMPVMDGLTATRSIRQLKKKTAKTIPIIAMSANAFDEDVEKSIEAGMNAHLSKPIEPQALYSALYRFMGMNKFGNP